MYTPPVTPWELEAPEAGDLTRSEVRGQKREVRNGESLKGQRKRPKRNIKVPVLSSDFRLLNGRELSKVKPMTGVKS